MGRKSAVFFPFLVLFAGLVHLPPPLPAQAEIPLKTVGPGYLVVRAQVCRAGVKMDRHLLLDFLSPVPLVYFPSEALFLGIRERKGAKVDLEIGDTTLHDVPVLLAKLRLLQEVTRDYATGLGEVPVVGILGFKALQRFRVELDPIDEALRLLPPALPGDLPPSRADRWILPLVLDQGPPRFRALLAGKVEGFLYLATGWPHSFLFSGALSRAGLEGKPVKDLKVGDARLSGIVPFRSMEVENLFYRLPGPLLGGLGWDFLRSFHLVLDGVNKVAVLDRVRHDPFPEEEQAYLLARAGGVEGLRAFLDANPGSAFAGEAAREVFSLLVEEGASGGELVAAGRKWAALTPPPRRAAVFYEVARKLLKIRPFPPGTEQVLREGIEASRLAAEKEVAYRIQHLAGRFYLAKKAYHKARRHLLNAVFGLIHEGPVNLDLGLCWEGLNKPNRAMGAFVRALLDAEKSGPEALGALAHLWDEDFGKGKRLGFTEKLLERLEGRTPVFHPPGKAGKAPFHPPHRPLVELFSGSDCDPCAGADLAFEGAVSYFGEGAVFLTYHLHVPSPDPLTVPAGFARAGRLGVRGTPTLFVDGKQVLDGGGGARMAPSLFEKIRAAVEKARAARPKWILSGRGRLDLKAGLARGVIHVQGPPCAVQVWLAARRQVYPGLNGIVIHPYVARARLLPREGVLPGRKGDVPFQARLPQVWKEIRDSLDDLEARLQEKDFHFRWKPDRPDPAELVFVATVYPPGTSTPGESLLLFPEGFPSPKEKARTGPASRPTGPGAGKGAGKGIPLKGGLIRQAVQRGTIRLVPPPKKGGSGH